MIGCLSIWSYPLISLHGILPSMEPIIKDSWLVFFIAATGVVICSRKAPPGPSFTYSWLLVGALSYLLGSEDAKTLFFLIGFGLVCSWYGIQLVTVGIWDRLLVYWLDIFPAWCVSTIIRFGDITIHVVPFMLSIDYFDKVSIRHLIQALIFERLYFVAIEGMLVGNGRKLNEIYALKPPCPAKMFRKLQMLSTVGYCFASSICAPTLTQKRFLQLFWLAGFIVVGLDSEGYFDYVIRRILRFNSTHLTHLFGEPIHYWSCWISDLKEYFNSLYIEECCEKIDKSSPPTYALLCPLHCYNNWEIKTPTLIPQTLTALDMIDSSEQRVARQLTKQKRDGPEDGKSNLSVIALVEHLEKVDVLLTELDSRYVNPAKRCLLDRPTCSTSSLFLRTSASKSLSSSRQSVSSQSSSRRAKDRQSLLMRFDKCGSVKEIKSRVINLHDPVEALTTRPCSSCEFSHQFRNSFLHTSRLSSIQTPCQQSCLRVV